MPTLNITPALLDALAEIAGRPGFRGRGKAVAVGDALDAGLVTGRPGGFELTDAGRQLLDEHSRAIAGWMQPRLKADGTVRGTASSDHYFTGAAGNPMTSACGRWATPPGWGWPLPHYTGLAPTPNRPCQACARAAS